MAEGRPSPEIARRLHRLRSRAREVGPLLEEPVTLPWSGRVYPILRPADTDLLLQRAIADAEQNLPYWAEIWPSGIALGDAIGRRPELVQGKRVLELGSGLGVTAIAALQAGAELTVADYSPESLVLCRYNALRNAGREPATLRVNWRRPGRSLADLGDGFPVVVAADVLYEARDVEPLLGLVARLIAPGGLLWLAEPGRPPARRFLQAAQEAGWQVSTEAHPGPWPDPKDQAVVAAMHRLWRR